MLRDRTTDIATLNTRLKHHAAVDILRTAFAEIPRIALVSSFGAESVVLLHIASKVKPDVQVIFVDTMLLFSETLRYQKQVARVLGLRKVRVVRADTTQDPDNTLHQSNPDACCTLRKTQALAGALKSYDGWITGRKRFQSDQRAELPAFEVEADTDRIKVNPLAHWGAQDVHAYMDENNLPRHPLVARGYPSIGCAPCTTPVAKGEDPRAGRWRDTAKTECGIHFAGGTSTRIGAPA